MRIRALDPSDPADAPVLRTFWEVEQAAQRDGREHAVLRDWAALSLSAFDPSSRIRHVWLVAEEGGEVVGCADLVLALRDNLHLAELEVNVLPGHRRRGIGRALHDEAVRIARADGRTTFLGEANGPVEGGGAAVAFATALGFTSVHDEHHLVLPLPASPPRPDVPGYEVLSWSGPVPPDLRAEYVAMETRMNADVPSGDIDHVPTEVTLEDLDEQERRMGKAYDWVTAVARSGDGTLAGFSLVYVPHGASFGWQDSTLVMPTHRGHGLGLALKGATLTRLVEEHPGLTAIHTWTTAGNHAMYRTNQRFGFVAVERLDEMQRVEAGRGGGADRPSA